MKSLLNLICFFSVSGLLLFSCSREKPASGILKFSGPYIGQKLPGSDPEIFAPGLVNTGPYTRDLAISPDGREIFFCMSVPRYSAILVTREEADGWTEPEVVQYLNDPRYYYFEPCFSPGGNKLYFLSNMPDTSKGETKTDQDIWVMDKTDNGWSKPYNLGPPVNTDNEEYFPSLTDDGTIYFTRAEPGSQVQYIYRSRYVDGKFQDPVLLPENVNCGKSRYNAYISRDESFIIVPATGMPDSFGGTDYYISFRDEGDNWSAPVNMGPTVNTIAEREFSASLSPDGRFLFFMSQRELVIPDKFTYSDMKRSYFEAGYGNTAIYWVDAGFIKTLKK